MKVYHFPLFVSILLAPAACSPTVDAESEGQKYLQKAREALAAKDYEQAKSEILALREKQPKALNAREEGIILMDSIDLLKAQSDLWLADSIMRNTPSDRHTNDMKFTHEEATQRAAFFSRKLQYDLNNRKVHK